MAKPNTSDIELPDISSDSSSGWEPQGNGTWKDSGGNIIYDENTIPADSPFENPPGGFPSTIEAPSYTPPLMPGPGPTPPPVPGPAPEPPASLPPLEDTDGNFGNNSPDSPTQECPEGGGFWSGVGNVAYGILEGVAVAAAATVVVGAAVVVGTAVGVPAAVGTALLYGATAVGGFVLGYEIGDLLQNGDITDPETQVRIGGLLSGLIPVAGLAALGERFGLKILGKLRPPKAPVEVPPKVPVAEPPLTSGGKPVVHEPPPKVPDAEPAPAAPKGTKVKYRSDLEEHIKYPDPPKGGSIGGAHNAEEFQKAITDQGGKVVNETSHPTIDGIKKIEYKMPAKDKAGKPTGDFQSGTPEKTVYDPSKISDDQMIKWGKEAVENAASTGQLTSGCIGEAKNGLRIKIYLDKNGAVRTFFPIF